MPSKLVCLNLNRLQAAANPSLQASLPAWRIKKLQPKGYIIVRTQFNNVCTFHELYVNICTRNPGIYYTNLSCTGLYIVCTCLYDSKHVYTCIYMYRHVWTMYIHVYSSWCTSWYHVCTMYIHLKKCINMYIHVHEYVFMSVPCMYSVHTIALYVHGTYMVLTCLYTFMPGG